MIAALLPDRLPWWLAGPALGLLVVGFFLVANQPLGATGAYVETANTVMRRPGAVTWRAWYFVGIAVGGWLAVSLKDVGVDPRAGYEVLTSDADMGLSLPVAALVIFVGAVVMGYGARMAGGCTSGHGICGTAQRSPASWAAMISFMATAVITTAVINAIG